MVSPEWFFSTLAQSVAAITGFIITIITVVYQHDRNNRQIRTSELRNHLIKLDEKYGEVTNSALESLKQPFEGKVPDDGISPDQWKDGIPDESIHSEVENPITNQIWVRTYRISSIMNNIGPAENSEENYLLTQEEIDELREHLDFIKSRIFGDDESIADEIGESNVEDTLTAETPLFETDTIEYLSLDNWFNMTFDEHEPKNQLKGDNLLSLQNFYTEFYKDVTKIDILANNTLLDGDNILSNLLKPVLIVILVGIILPHLSLLSFQGGGIRVSPPFLTLYQSALLTVSMIAIFYLISEIWPEL